MICPMIERQKTLFISRRVRGVETIEEWADEHGEIWTLVYRGSQPDRAVCRVLADLTNLIAAYERS